MGKRPSFTAAEVARELGVRRNKIYKWDEQFKNKGTDEVFPGPGRRVGAAAEIARLQRENARLQEENEILKKATWCFARASRESQSHGGMICCLRHAESPKILVS